MSNSMPKVLSRFAFPLLVVILGAASAGAQPVYTAPLTYSGDGGPVVLLTGAIDPAPGLTPPLAVTVPVAGDTLLGIVNPAIAIPPSSAIREVEAFWNATRLPLVDSWPSELVEEAHSYGSMIPFFKPVFSLAGLPAGSGTLEVRGFDAQHRLLATVQIPSLRLAVPPAAVPLEALAARPHPRLWLTPQRLAIARGRASSDPFASRYREAVDRFLNALDVVSDPTSPAFASIVYDPESYVEALALTWHIERERDPARAVRAADAARTLVVHIANAYASGDRSFGRDTGYDIRFGLMHLMIGYDWLWDRLTPAERDTIADVAANWVYWYRDTPGYAATKPYENYYAGYLQGVALTGVGLAGESPAANTILALLRDKLRNEMPILNQRQSGGDWCEGWNYGPYSVQEMLLVRQLLADHGEDWSPAFAWIEGIPRQLLYQMSPDFRELRSFGGYSGSVPHKTSPALLAVLSSLTADGAFADYLYEHANAEAENDFLDWSRGATAFEMLFGAHAADPALAALPLSRLAAGTGRWISRSSLTDRNAYQATAECTSYSYDHYGYANGDVRLYRGAECLVCPAAYSGEDFRGEDGTPAFSTYIVGGREQQLPRGRNNQILFATEGESWSAVGMRFESSYVESRYDEDIVDPTMALDGMVRVAVHVRPGTLVVRDLHRRRRASVELIGYWHFGSMTGAQSTGSGRWRLGDLDVATFSSQPVTWSYGPEYDGSANRIGTLATLTFPPSDAVFEVVTVFSETVTATSYTGGVLTLSDGTRVSFGASGVTVSDGGAPYTKRAVVPGVARTAGSIGSSFRSALWITNPGSEKIEARLLYVPAAGQGSGGGAPSREVQVPAGRALAYGDALTELFGGSGDTSGVLVVEVREGHATPLVAARTYNQGTSGTYGQYIQAVPLPGSAAGERFAGLGGGTASRTNIGVVSLSDASIAATIALRDPAGAPVGGAVAANAGPYSSKQINRADVAAGAGGLADFGASVTAATPFFAYASRLDGVTSDPIFIPGGLAARTRQWIDGVAAAPGAGVFFRSSLSLANDGAVATNVTLTFTRRGETVPAATAPVTLAAGQSRWIDDAVVALFGLTNAAGAIVIVSDAPIVAWARTYSDLGASGTFGQFIPAFGSEDLLGVSGAVLQGISDSASFRANAGFVNTSTAPVSVRFEVWRPDGTKAGERTETIAAGSARFFFRIVSQVTGEAISGGYLRVMPASPGAIYAWASIVDVTSSDQTFVRPQRLQ